MVVPLLSEPHASPDNSYRSMLLEGPDVPSRYRIAVKFLLFALIGTYVSNTLREFPPRFLAAAEYCSREDE